MPIDFHVMPAGPATDQSARFEATVLPHLDAAYNLARWLAHHDTDAEDVAQESLLRAFRYFGSFHGGDARVWLLAIVRNTYYTLRMKTPPGGSHELFDEDIHTLADEQPSPETLTLLAADIGAMQHALEALPYALREVIVLRELEECSYKEIAAITQLKIGTVMSRLARARQRLATQLTSRPLEARRHDV